MQRFYVLLDGEITQEKTEASIRRHMAPHTVKFTHIEWFSKFESKTFLSVFFLLYSKRTLTPFPVKERVASTFTHPTPAGPFILAGDAAHVHSVNGGQGMNTGLCDSFNLIWRLHFLLRHPTLPQSTRDSLLASYDTERRSTATHVIDVAAKLVRSTLSAAKQYVQLIEQNAGFITGMGVQYAGLSSPRVRDSKHGVWEAGHRAPDLWLDDSRTGDAVRLYQKMLYGRYLLVLAGSAREVAVQKPEFVTVLRMVCLKAKQVGVQTRGEIAVDERVHADAFGCSYIRAGDEYAVLVRPDCYVEYVAGVDEVMQYVEHHLPGLLTGGGE